MPYFDLKTVTLANALAPNDRLPFGDVSADAWGGISFSDLLTQILTNVPSTPPGGSTTQLQYNNAGAFGGVSGFTWDSSLKLLSLASPGRLGVGVALPLAAAHVQAQAQALDSLVVDASPTAGVGLEGDVARFRDSSQQVVVTVARTMLKVSQPGGVSGTNETQYYQDANGGWIVEKSGTYLNLASGSSMTIGRNPASPSNTGYFFFSGSRLRLDHGIVFGWCAADAVSGDLDTSLERGSSATLIATAVNLTVRQPGGTAGVDEVQISHDGTYAVISSMDGALFLKSGSGGTHQGRIFASRSADVLNVNQPFSFNCGNPAVVANFRADCGIGWSSSDSDVTAAVDTGLARSAPGVVKVTDGSTGIGALLTASVVEANTAGSGSPNVLTAVESRKTLTNEGTTAENYHTLPPAAAGLRFQFVCQDSDGIRITADTGDTIRIAGSVSASAGFVRSSTVGSVLILEAINATEWVALSSLGTWTIDS